MPFKEMFSSVALNDDLPDELPVVKPKIIVKKKEEWNELEKSDLIDAVDTWLLAYQNKHNNKTERQRPRMVALKKKLE